MKQSPRAPEPRKPPSDFCPGEAWPKQAPGPPAIMNPVVHSPARPASALRMLNPSQLDGPTRGLSEAKLLVKYAADKQQGELSLLLKGGQNPNVMEKVEWQPFATTPLFEASVNGYKRIVRVLLEHGAKVDTIVGPGFTAVYNAALNGHFECTRLLVDAGANVGLLTDAGYSALYAAPRPIRARTHARARARAAAHDVRLSCALAISSPSVPMPPPSSPPPAHDPPLPHAPRSYVACQGGHADCVADLLSSPTMTKAIADLALPDSGATPLYVAAQNGHPFCVKLLLDAGVAVDPLMAEDGSSPCMIAMFLAERDADAPHIKIVELLLRAGADLNLKNKKGETVMDLAKNDNSMIDMVEEEIKLREREGKGGAMWW